MSKLSLGTPQKDFSSGMSSEKSSSPISPKYSSFSSPSSQNSDFQVNDLQVRMKLLQTKYTKEIDNLKEELDRAREESIEKSEKLTKIQMERDGKYNEQQKLLSETTNQKLQLQMQIESFLSQISSKLGQNVKSLREATQLFSNIAAESGSSQDSLMSLQQMHEEVQENFQNVANELTESKRENKRLKNALKSASYQIENIPDIDEVVKPYEEKIEELVSSFEKEREIFQNEIADKENRIKELKLKIEDIITKQKEINQTDNEKQVLEAQNTLLNEKLHILQDENEKNNKEIEKLKTVISEMSEELEGTKESLNTAQKELEDRDQIIYKTLENKNGLKKKNEIAKNTVRTIDAELAAATSRINELELKLTMCQEENNKLKSKVEAPKSLDSDDLDKRRQEEFIQLLESVDSFEQVIKSQREEINKLSKARSSLISTLQQSMLAIEAVENSYKEAQSHIEQLQEANEDLRESMSNDQAKENIEFNKSFERMLELIPKDIVEEASELSEMKKGDILVKIVEMLIAHNEEESQYPTEEYEALQTKCKALLAHLSNCSKFISKLTKTPIVNNDEGRVQIMSQCMRINRYIEEQSITLPTPEFSRPSIFEPEDLNSPESVAKIFFDFVGDEEIDQTPYAELYSLFCSLIQINMMLMDSIDQHKQQAIDITSLQAYNKGLTEKLRDASVTIEIANAERQQLTPVLSKYVSDPPPEEFSDLIQEFCKTMKDGPISTEAGKKLKEDLEESNNMCEEIKEQMISEREAMEAERMQFCQKADEMVAHIEDEVVKQAAEMNTKISELNQELVETKAENQRLNDEIKQENEEHQKKKQEMDEDIKETKEMLETTNQQLKEARTNLDESNSEIAQLRNDIQELQETTENDMRVVLGKLQRETQRKLKYKERALLAEQQNSSTIAEVKERTESLASQYGSSISQLQTELSNARNRIKDQETLIAGMQPEKDKMMRDLAKMKISERSALIKVEDLRSALQQERDINEAKMKSASIVQKHEIEKTKKEYSDKIKSYRNLVHSILNDNKLMKLGDAEFIEAALPRLNELVGSSDSRTASEAIRLKRSIGLSENESLIDEFKRLYNNSFIAEESTKKIRNELNASIKEQDRLTRENKRLELSKQELSDWIRWGRSIFHQIKEVDTATVKGSDVRFVIEEQILASLNYKAIGRKMDILRSEKLLLLNKETELEANKAPVNSLRPLIVISIFTRSLQNMSGCIPAKYFTRQKTEPTRPIVPFN